MKRTLINIVIGIFISFIAFIISDLVGYFYFEIEKDILLKAIKIEIIVMIISGIIIGLLEELKIHHKGRISILTIIYVVFLEIFYKGIDEAFDIMPIYVMQAPIVILLIILKDVLKIIFNKVKHKIEQA